MRFAFLDPNLAHDYDVDSPFEKPLAGSQSAQCYLAVELAARGHRVELFTGIKRQHVSRGVHCFPVQEFGVTGIPDVLFVLNCPPCARQLRKTIGPELPIYCWEHNPWNPDSNYHEHLAAPLSPRDRILCVSEWQRNQYAKAGVAAERMSVLRNAISPWFECFGPHADQVFSWKAWPAVMAFTSTPYKGLKAAVRFFEELRRRDPIVTLNIFSSFDLYPPNNEHRLDSSWRSVYEKCQATAGINYVGNVTQAELARSLRSTLVLFFPSILPETSSICIMEAMAAGCVVIYSAIGGLPEAAHGFGRVIELEDGGRIVPGQRFVSATLDVLERFQRGDDALRTELERQTAHFHKHCRWSARACELECLLRENAGGP